jgi:glutaminyl-peptide cyclotransferase
MSRQRRGGERRRGGGGGERNVPTRGERGTREAASGEDGDRRSRDAGRAPGSRTTAARRSAQDPGGRGTGDGRSSAGRAVGSGRRDGGIGTGKTVAVVLLLVAAILLAWWLWGGGRAGADGGRGDGGEESGTETAAPMPGGAAGDAAAAASPPALRRLRARVVARYPHDPDAFTQGLLLHEGVLYESTGRYGESSLRRVEVETGKVLDERPLPADWFGEGLARVPGVRGAGDRLVQLTWQEGVAPLWSLDGLARTGEHRYQGEGWGLCYDAAWPGGRLVMSDGSARLTFRDPASFEETGAVTVAHDGRPIAALNELECVAGRVWANLLGSGQIVEIDPATGRLTALLDASGLLTPEERFGTDVLNGIAHDGDTGTWLLTGKLWPWVFRVELVEG